MFMYLWFHDMSVKNLFVRVISCHKTTFGWFWLVLTIYIVHICKVLTMRYLLDLDQEAPACKGPNC